MSFKFEQLEVWELTLEYIDTIYEIAEQLPRSEEYNLKSQIKRAVTSVALNIAEGSTGQTDTEQAHFIGLAIRSLIETVACIHIIQRRKLVNNVEALRHAYREADKLTAKLQSFRRAVSPEQKWVREDAGVYQINQDM